MMSKQDKSILKTLVSSNAFNAMNRLADEMILNWSGTVSEDDQFKYLKASFERDGKQMGVRMFLQQIEQFTNEE